MQDKETGAAPESWRSPNNADKMAIRMARVLGDGMIGWGAGVARKAERDAWNEVRMAHPREKRRVFKIRKKCRNNHATVAHAQSRRGRGV